MLKNAVNNRNYESTSLEGAALAFLKESCEGLRFNQKMAKMENAEQGIYLGKSLSKDEIPYNMQMDIDRLCLENAVERFLRSGKKMLSMSISATWRCSWVIMIRRGR